MLNSNNYNPDVLTCLANLSNDEVFTPPQLANHILDLLPPEIWSDKNTTFLDPVSKSGVFLREIARRLDAGLETEIPDKQKRINHIFSNQLFGIAITELTSLLSRRSVYCSKTANGNIPSASVSTTHRAISVLNGSSITGKTGAVYSAVPVRPTMSAAKNLKPMPISLSIQKNQRRYLI